MKRFMSIIICLAITIASISGVTQIVFAAGAPTITCENKICNPGETITVDVVVSNNPGIMYLELTPTYSQELGTPNIVNGDLISDITKGKNLIWVSDEDIAEDGKLVSLTFNLSDTIAKGDYTVNFVFRGAYNYDEQDVAFTVVPGTITICGHGSTHPVPAESSTCQTHGHPAYIICDICGKVISGSAEELPLDGHNYVANVTPPTCLTGGYTTYTCSVCGDSYVSDITEPLGHSWGEWQVIKQATDKEDGVEICYCNNDHSHIMTRSIPAYYTPLSDFTYRLARGKIHITGYIGNDSEIVIPETYIINGRERQVTTIEESAFEANDTITSVSLPATITSIEPYAFYDCTSLSNVVIWSKYAEIGEKAFGYYYISVKSDGKVDGFNLTTYAGGTVQAYVVRLNPSTFPSDFTEI